MIYIFWTCKTIEEAKKICNELLGKRLIACASIIPGITSLYRWQGKLEEGREIKIILKTTHDHFTAIEQYIKTRCSYEVPEIAAIPVSSIHAPYLDWVHQEVS